MYEPAMQDASVSGGTAVNELDGEQAVQPSPQSAANSIVRTKASAEAFRALSARLRGEVLESSPTADYQSFDQTSVTGAYTVDERHPISDDAILQSDEYEQQHNQDEQHWSQPDHGHDGAMADGTGDQFYGDDGDDQAGQYAETIVASDDYDPAYSHQADDSTVGPEDFDFSGVSADDREDTAPEFEPDFAETSLEDGSAYATNADPSLDDDAMAQTHEWSGTQPGTEAVAQSEFALEAAPTDQAIESDDDFEIDFALPDAADDSVEPSAQDWQNPVTSDDDDEVASAGQSEQQAEYCEEANETEPVAMSGREDTCEPAEPVMQPELQEVTEPDYAESETAPAMFDFDPIEDPAYDLDQEATQFEIDELDLLQPHGVDPYPDPDQLTGAPATLSETGQVASLQETGDDPAGGMELELEPGDVALCEDDAGVLEDDADVSGPAAVSHQLESLAEMAEDVVVSPRQDESGNLAETFPSMQQPDPVEGAEPDQHGYEAAPQDPHGEYDYAPDETGSGDGAIQDRNTGDDLFDGETISYETMDTSEQDDSDSDVIAEPAPADGMAGETAMAGRQESLPLTEDSAPDDSVEDVVGGTEIGAAGTSPDQEPSLCEDDDLAESMSPDRSPSTIECDAGSEIRCAVETSIAPAPGGEPGSADDLSPERSAISEPQDSSAGEECAGEDADSHDVPDTSPELMDIMSSISQKFATHDAPVEEGLAVEGQAVPTGGLLGLGVEQLGAEFDESQTDPEAGEAARMLLDIMSQPSGAAQPQERALAADTLLRLVTKIPVVNLIGLSERICMMEQPPVLLVNKLIRHPDIRVSGPLLEGCGALSDQVLLPVVRAADNEKRRMIARRLNISAALSDVLLEHGDASVLLTIVRNPGAALSHDAFGALSEHAKNQPSLQAPLVTRGDTPAPTAFELFWFLPSELRRYVLSRFLTDSETLNRILRIAQSVDEHAESEVGREPKTADKRSIEGLVAAIEAGSSGEAADLLSEMAGINRPNALRIISDPDGEPLSVAMKAIGISRAQFLDAMTRWQRSSGCLIRNERPTSELQNLFDSLSFNKARVLLTYWDWAAIESGPYARKAA